MNYYRAPPCSRGHRYSLPVLDLLVQQMGEGCRLSTIILVMKVVPHDVDEMSWNMAKGPHLANELNQVGWLRLRKRLLCQARARTPVRCPNYRTFQGYMYRSLKRIYSRILKSKEKALSQFSEETASEILQCCSHDSTALQDMIYEEFQRLKAKLVEGEIPFNQFIAEVEIGIGRPLTADERKQLRRQRKRPRKRDF